MRVRNSKRPKEETPMRISYILAVCLATSVLTAPALAADKMKPADTR